MYYRRKILLALLEQMGGRLMATDMQKLLFLYCEKLEEKKYEFVPYKFGGVSFQSYADKRTLTKYGFLAQKEHWELTKKGVGITKTLKAEDLSALQFFKKENNQVRGDVLVRKVYEAFPYYAINSEIAEKVLSTQGLQKVDSARPKQKSYCFFTIGYEGISLENYLNKLIRSNVKLLCDVRKNPLSMKWGFSKNQLLDNCKKVGITYLHIPELGIVSAKRKELNTQADYDKLFTEYEKTTLWEERKSLNDLVALMKQYRRVAITCFEACEGQCHRGRVAKALEKLPAWDYRVKHL